MSVAEDSTSPCRPGTTTDPDVPSHHHSAPLPTHAGATEPATAKDSNGAVQPRKWRIALYSHDTTGLGHMRRNLRIARAIVASRLPASVLLIAGAREACAFTLPPGVDCLALPALYRDANGQYRSRCLDVSITDLVALRAKTIAAALAAFEPDVLIVDTVPRGPLRELDLALQLLAARGRTRCLLGLRDVLDDPAIVRSEWSVAANEDVIRDVYDAIWVYGDPRVYDQVYEYGYPAAVAAKVRYLGYVTRPLRTTFSQIDGVELLPAIAGPPERLSLCMVGGGQDGMSLAEAFAQVDFPHGTTGVVVTGPFMPAETHQRLCRCAAANPQLRVLKFVTDPDLLLSLADRVIAMGGYNTVCELLAFGKRALIVPRIKPTREQFIRAERLRSLGLVDMLHPDEVSPRALNQWLAHDLQLPAATSLQIDFDGAANLPRVLAEILGASADPSANGHIDRRAQYAAC